jgi:hypothetical protein
MHAKLSTFLTDICVAENTPTVLPTECPEFECSNMVHFTMVKVVYGSERVKLGLSFRKRKTWVK